MTDVCKTVLDLREFLLNLVAWLTMSMKTLYNGKFIVFTVHIFILHREKENHLVSLLLEKEKCHSIWFMCNYKMILGYSRASVIYMAYIFYMASNKHKLFHYGTINNYFCGSLFVRQNRDTCNTTRQKINKSFH